MLERMADRRAVRVRLEDGSVQVAEVVEVVRSVEVVALVVKLPGGRLAQVGPDCALGRFPDPRMRCNQCGSILPVGARVCEWCDSRDVFPIPDTED
jgi:hypothetical protein